MGKIRWIGENIVVLNLREGIVWEIKVDKWYFIFRKVFLKFFYWLD